MIFDYTKEKYQIWDNFRGTTFSRRLENETAFDGIVKVYSFQTDSDKINQLIKGLFFHKFFYPTRNGLILRQFESKNSWPKTKLIHLNLDTGELVLIKKTDSSYDSWDVEDLGHDRYLISITPKETVEFENK